MAKLIFITCFTIALISLACAQQSPQDKTNAMIAKLLGTYGADKINQLLPCTLIGNCTSCTSNSGCVWVSGSTTVGFWAYRTSDQSNIIETTETNFCWSGSGIGINTNNVAAQTISKDDTIISTNAGFNDISWQQCKLLQGAVLAIGLIIPLAAIIIFAIASICICICCYRLKKKWSKDDREKMVPKEDKKKNWLSRRKK
jgi:hypothetical protein